MANGGTRAAVYEIKNALICLSAENSMLEF